jgi:hypothetical protein
LSERDRVRDKELDIDSKTTSCFSSFFEEIKNKWESTFHPKREEKESNEK